MVDNVFIFDSVELCRRPFQFSQTSITFLRNPVQCEGVTRYLYTLPFRPIIKVRPECNFQCDSLSFQNWFDQSRCTKQKIDVSSVARLVSGKRTELKI